MTVLPERYDHARRAFLSAAQVSGARVSSVFEPHGVGPDGERLAMDIARTGPDAGGPVVVVLSGVHGVEGLAGSAVQARWLAKAPADLAAVFVHAVNPWGFSFLTRCDRENVDLNRNFIEDFSAPPANRHYQALHPILQAPAWKPDALARQDVALDAFAAVHGVQALTDALIGGQYEFADGLNYGGRCMAWPVAALCDLVRDLGSRHEAVVLLDLHTGVAPPGHAAVLPFAGPVCDAATQQLLTAGDRRISIGAPGLATMTGLLVAGLARQAAPRPTLAAVVEFGTVDKADIRRALRIDLSLRGASAAYTDDGAVEDARLRVVEAFFPSDPTWRTSLISLTDSLAGTLLKRDVVISAFL
jgi:hypothetical protein